MYNEVILYRGEGKLKRSAVFDESNKYRFSLERIWDKTKGKITFILLNPSVATGTSDDPTTTRCINLAKQFGYGRLEIVNLFSYIATYPYELEAMSKELAIGKENQRFILQAVNSADISVAGWGVNCYIHNRYRDISEIFKGHKLYCLGDLSKEGHPQHPLARVKVNSLNVFLEPQQEAIKLKPTVQRRVRKINHSHRPIDDRFIWCYSCHSEHPTRNGLCKECFEKER